MPTPRDLANEINAILTAPDGVMATDAASVAEVYAAYCRRANDRLRRCADYLRRGLRGEAIHHAELKPDILDLVGELDVPRIEDWQSLCRHNGWDVPPRLLEDSAQDLNAAYTAHRAIEHLLKKQRLLALARAPLSERLAVLRSLAHNDPGNQLWEDDLKVFEAARLKEIVLEAKAAAETRDRQALLSLLNELKTPGWRVEVPRTHIDAIRKVLRSFQVKDAIAELRDLLEKLDQAYMAMSYEECEPLVAEWGQIVTDHKVSVPSEMQTRVQPILDWVAAQRATRESQVAFAQACAELERALDVQASTEELRRLHVAARSFDQPLPAELHRRYETDLGSRELTRRRKTRVVMAFAGVATVVVAIAVVLLVQAGIRRSHAQDWAQQIRTAIDKGELDRATKMVDTLKREDARLLERAELVDVRTRLEAALAKQDADSKQFCVILDEIKVDDLATRPSKEDIAKTRLRLTDAERLARLPRQQLEVTEVRARVNEIEAKWQKEVDDALLADIEKFRKSCDALPPSALDRNLDDYATRVAALAKELAAIQPRHANGSTQVLSMLNPLKERLKGMEDAVARAQEVAKRNRRKDEALSALPQSANSAKQLAERLLDFAKEYPDDPRATSFRDAAGKQLIWSAVQDYHQLVAPWGPGLHPKDLPDLERRLQAIKAFLTKYDIVFNRDGLSRYADYLSLAQKAMQPDGPWKGDLMRIVNGPLMRKLLHIKTKDGKTYYIPSGTEVKVSSVDVQVAVLMSKDLGHTEIRFVANPAFPKPKPAPQVALAEEIEKRIQDLNPANWDTTGLELMQLIQTHGEVDPVLRLALLYNVAKRHFELSWWLEPSKRASPKEFEEDIKAIEEANWVDPDDRDMRQARKIAQDTFADFFTKTVRVDQLLADLPKSRESMRESLKNNLAGHGVAIRNQSGWTVLAPHGVLTNGRRLSVVAPGTDNSSPTLLSIGTVTAGKPVVSEKDMNQIPEGSLVFIWEK